MSSNRPWSQRNKKRLDPMAPPLRLLAVLKTVVGWCVILAICVFLGACGHKDEKVIARVNGAELTLDDLYAEIPEYYLHSITHDQKLRFVERWINGELLYQEALRRGLQKEDPIREKVLAAEKNILIAELIQRELEERVQIPEEEVQQYYQDHLEDFTRKADEVRASQILVPTLEEANRIKKELEAGEDFARLAREFSVDPTAEQGGDLGYFAREDVLAAVAKAAFSLSPGVFSGPIKTEFGYHLIVVTDVKKKGSVRSLDLVREEILGGFSADKELDQLYLFLQELREENTVTQNPELLNMVSSAETSIAVSSGDTL